MSLAICCLLSTGSLMATPNIVLIYADDLGYGDLGCYGGQEIPTPHMDALAASGIRFTDAYATSATCTPSRYALLTGIYPWRKKGHGILDGNAPLIIPPGSATVPSILQKAGYKTAVVGKWHLGLGSQGKPMDWNKEISPGPRSIGFDFCHIMAATGDRVPCVFVENERVMNLDPQDPIAVSYGRKIGAAPSGREKPEQLILPADNQHSDSVINGISRIGYMTGGKAALWNDEEMGDHFTRVAIDFVEKNKEKPFFLYLAMHEPHAPRVPAPRFVGRTKLGPRGDVIAQLDDHVGRIVGTLKKLQLEENTLIVVSSDNGPVLFDGYQDEADAKNGSHKPAGPLSGGKYSKLEGGTRVPLILNWPGQVKPSVSTAVVSQIDFLASFASLVNQPVPEGAAMDSRDTLDTLLGKSTMGRNEVVQEGIQGLAIRCGDWKLIPPHKGSPTIKDMRSGNDPKPQLYHLKNDPSETSNLAGTNPGKTRELAEQLETIRSMSGNRSSALE